MKKEREILTKDQTGFFTKACLMGLFFIQSIAVCVAQDKNEGNIQENYPLYLFIIICLIVAFSVLFYEFKKTYTKEETAETPKKKDDINKLQAKKQVNKINESPKLQHWFSVGASVIGKSHIENNIVCQDAHVYQKLDSRAGIAVVCDGAGSAVNSALGSRFIADKAIRLFTQILKEEQWQEKQTLPDKDKWHSISKEALLKLRHDLEDYAKSENLKIATLACTVIVLIHTPIGILVTHIGDGRAGYCNAEGEWKPLIEPWKGEEANQTVFITSAIWETPDDYIASNVITEPYTAFTLMSDGCERHSFQLSSFDETTQKYTELNLPYPKFFNPLVQSLKTMHQNNLSAEEINQKWKNFLEMGNEGLKNEPDDKTLILGILLA